MPRFNSLGPHDLGAIHPQELGTVSGAHEPHQGQPPAPTEFFWGSQGLPEDRFRVATPSGVAPAMVQRLHLHPLPPSPTSPGILLPTVAYLETPGALSLPAPLTGPPALNEGLLRRRTERMVDTHIYQETLGTVLSLEPLALLREQIIEHLMVLPRDEGAALCDAAATFAGPKASAMAKSQVLRIILQHQVSRASARGTELAARIKLAAREIEQSTAMSRSWDALLDVMEHYSRRAYQPSGLGLLVKKLMIARISPPELYTERWCARDLPELLAFADRATLPAYAYVRTVLRAVLPATASPWTSIHLAIAALSLPRPQPQGLPEVNSAAALQKWSGMVEGMLSATDAVVFLRVLFHGPPQDWQSIWQNTQILMAHLPRALPADIAQELALFVPVEEHVDFVRAVKIIVPSWVSTSQARQALQDVSLDLEHLGDMALSLFDTYRAPQMSLARRKELLRVLMLWQERWPGPQTTDRLPEAQQFIAQHQVPRALVAAVMSCLLLPPQGHPQLRLAMAQVLQSPLAPDDKALALHALGAIADDARQAWVATFLASPEVPPREEDLESSMQPGRLRASDSVIAQVMEQVPQTSRWHVNLQQIAAFVQAAKVDPKTDAMLLSTERTGVSELDNALYTLTGPRLTEDQTDALSANPPYALAASGKVVGLGYLAASLWQLLKDHPKDAADTPLAAAERQRGRVNLILALARSVEVSGRRVCGWGLSERLTEACVGYIATLNPPAIEYPEPLLRQAYTELNKLQGPHLAAAREAFFHEAVVQSQDVLHSPDAIRVFKQQLLAVMQLDHDWPE